MLGGGEIIALKSDGTEKWRIQIATDVVTSSPCISEDGTIYIGSNNDLFHPGSEGYLHAIGDLDTNAPSIPEINGPIKGVPDVGYNFTFESLSPIGNDLYYWIEWGDNSGTGWIGPYDSDEKVTVNHSWFVEGTYTIKARAKDTENLWGPWGELTVTMPRDKTMSTSLILKLLERFPLLEVILSKIINL
jgi:hypothetical protein